MVPPDERIVIDRVVTHGPTRRRTLCKLGAASVIGLLAAQRGVMAAQRDGGVFADLEVDAQVIRRSVPDSFLGFNLNALSFGIDHLQDDSGLPKPALVEALRSSFPSAFYRYPGGNLSNHFLADAAMGPPGLRTALKLTEHRPPSKVRFGPAEYYRFLANVGGQSWYTLNLLGWDSQDMEGEKPLEVVVAAAARVAGARSQLDPSPGDAHYYHLGNELDRNRYRWPPQKYLERARAVMTAVRRADPKARFVAFLRDFDLKSSVASPHSDALQHAIQVLSGLPEIDDVSLQVYYDRDAGESTRFDLVWRWGLIDRFLGRLGAWRGRRLNVWVTEHAMAKPELSAPGPRLDRLAMTSGLSGAIASADFVLAALARPHIQATFWHALGGGAWWDLFLPGQERNDPTPAFHVLRLLRDQLVGSVLSCKVASSNRSRYAGGYDVNAAALRSTEGGWRVLVVNRADGPAAVSASFPGPAGLFSALLTSVLGGNDSAGTLPLGLRAQVDQTPLPPWDMGQQAKLAISVPARSVSVLRLTPVAGAVR